jgi:cell division protein FtsI/penicillin-binding protein 2
LQVVKSSEYKAEREEQLSYVPESMLNRGSIYARRKDGELVKLAGMKEMYKLTLAPKEIPKTYEDRLYEKLSVVYEIDRSEFDKRVSKKSDPYEELGVISPSLATEIDDLNLVGVHTYKYSIREYPLAQVGAKVVGFVGSGDEGMKGRYGLEKYYDDVLQVDSSKTSYFLVNVFNNLKANNLDTDVRENDSIVTTLEPNVMQYLYTFLGDLQSEWGADMVAGIVYRPATGEILAMDALPTYDPNKYKDYDVSTYNNPLVQGVYEMGSIVKPITIALGIDHGLVSPVSYFHDTGSVFIDGYTIKNFDGKIRGDVTMQTVLGQSLNTGLVYVMRQLGMERFRDGFIHFGLEEETGIDLPGEVSNKLRNIHTNTEVNYATASFGQGIAISPISILRTLSSIVNGGVKVTPYLAESRVKTSGETESIVPDQSGEQVVKPESANTVRDMLVHIIDKDLANGKWADQYYKVGAKTGTAQLTRPGGGYYDDKFLHSYFTFFGEGESQIAILVFQVNPKRGQLASFTLTPSVNRLKDFLTNYYQIKPDRTAVLQ